MSMVTLSMTSFSPPISLYGSPAPLGQFLKTPCGLFPGRRVVLCNLLSAVPQFLCSVSFCLLRCPKSQTGVFFLPFFERVLHLFCRHPPPLAYSGQTTPFKLLKPLAPDFFLPPAKEPTVPLHGGLNFTAILSHGSSQKLLPDPSSFDFHTWVARGIRLPPDAIFASYPLRLTFASFTTPLRLLSPPPPHWTVSGLFSPTTPIMSLYCE